MSEPFVAEIRMFAGNFAPRGWAFCNGQLLPIAQNTALFSIIGTIYGGDGQWTTGLPDLQGRAPMHPGRGPGLTSRRLGERGGVETVMLSEAQIPNHPHQQSVEASRAAADTSSPVGNRYGVTAAENIYKDSPDNNFIPTSVTLQNSGGSQEHNNMQPYLTVNFIIALVGFYPSRS